MTDTKYGLRSVKFEIVLIFSDLIIDNTRCLQLVTPF